MTLPDPTITHVLARVGGVPIAVAAAAVRAALPIPQQWHRLPRRQGAIVGVLPTACGRRRWWSCPPVEPRRAAQRHRRGWCCKTPAAAWQCVDALEGLAGPETACGPFTATIDDELFAAVLVNLGQSDAEREPGWMACVCWRWSG